MKTFQIDNGDLVLSSGSFSEVTGQRKLTQDLGLAMREPVGIDRFHPRWGSQLHVFLGHPASQAIGQRIQEEAQRILDNAMAIQQDNIRADAAAGRPSRYGTGEVINRVKDIATRQEHDSFHVRVALQTLSSDEVVLVSTVRN